MRERKRVDKTEAREVLRLHRPGLPDEADPRMADALRLAQEDSELAQWFEAHCQFYITMRARLKEIPVPADLHEKILRGEAIRRGRIVALRPFLVPLATAAMLILLGVAAWSFKSRMRGDVFADARERIVKQAERGYSMTKTSTNLALIHEFLVANKFPDYTLTKPLANLSGLGCATVDWRGRKVSMVCLLTRQNQELFLFVMDRANLGKAPETGQTEFTRIQKLMTASWTQDDKIYILAGTGKEADLKAYLE
jgi:hypothetical protein